MRSNRTWGAVRASVPVAMLAATMAVAGPWAATAGAASGGSAHAKALYVSAKKGKKFAPCTKKAPCKTIGRAVAKAPKHARIFVARGTYREDVKITKDIALIGSSKAVINASGLANGVLISGARATGASVHGFLVRNATFEGVLAENTSRVTISGDTLTSNDRGGSAKPQVGECAPAGVIPGDCGEGLHLMSVTHSRVQGNTVRNNAGGILLTDETGPTAHNVITGNKSLNNVLDCGITLAGHNPKAVILSTTPGPPTMAGLAPTVGGVYDNLISDNTSNGNGTQGQGGGIILAGGAPGTGVYDNTVTGNTAEGNGLAGVTLHSHAPGQDLNGNVITHNILSDDGLHGYPNGAPGDSDAGITQTVGITVWSAATPLSGTVITGNQISSDHYGIWTQHVPKIAKSANTFASTVTVPVFQK
jgi:parallel beta-helix repeat protein